MFSLTQTCSTMTTQKAILDEDKTRKTDQSRQTHTHNNDESEIHKLYVS